MYREPVTARVIATTPTAEVGEVAAVAKGCGWAEQDTGGRGMGQEAGRELEEKLASYLVSSSCTPRTRASQCRSYSPHRRERAAVLCVAGRYKPKAC